MDNNDRLVRLRYALDIKDNDAVEIFKLGGIEVTEEEVRVLIAKSQDDSEEDYRGITSSKKLESFLNGLIIFKRGKQEPKEGQPVTPILTMQDNESANNIMLKKLKIALSLDSDDVICILDEVGINVSKGELGAFFRKEGHPKYKECGDKYARNFLSGLEGRYRS